MNSVSYPYSQGNRLEDRNTYFYSEYHGEAFLPAWETSRRDALNRLPVPEAPNIKPPKSLNASEYHTAELLGHLLNTDLDTTANKYLAGKLLQRFEVSKRLYRRYDTHFKAVLESGYDDLALYPLFAAMCLRHAPQPHSLPFLNALLKTIDTLISLENRLTAIQGAQLAWLIEGEAKWVMQLANRLEIRAEK